MHKALFRLGSRGLEQNRESHPCEASILVGKPDNQQGIKCDERSIDSRDPCLIPHLIVTIVFFLDVSTLVGRCPSLVHLDLSDSVMLKSDCFPEFFQLNYLQHLSLSRCYDIIPETLLELGEIPTLKTLQVFGIVPDSTLQLLKEALPHLQINCSPFTTIARPTTGNKKNQEIWGIRCRLTLQKPSCL
ncbi:S-phase kinase-associated protein 2 [Physeter macrocephalus]|uniref:S-phase kinase-associated protein 2 n=1 Tax=Physeter macrocephalus TaxID=9755 RepID=A0A9W2WUY0_PHYMC|nr:S-phase kinase-associated protein 2 [Physeter catodon]